MCFDLMNNSTFGDPKIFIDVQSSPPRWDKRRSLSLYILIQIHLHHLAITNALNRIIPTTRFEHRYFLCHTNPLQLNYPLLNYPPIPHDRTRP